MNWLESLEQEAQRILNKALSGCNTDGVAVVSLGGSYGFYSIVFYFNSVK